MRVLRKPEDQSRYLERRKAELGLKPEDFEAARNSGERRSAAKRKLLGVLAEEAKRQGRKLPFYISDDFYKPLPDDLLDAFEGKTR